MKVAINDIPKVLHTYVRQQIIPKMPASSPLQFLIGLGNSYIVNLGVDAALTKFLPTHYEMLKRIKVIDDQNMIDLEKLYENSLIALDECTGQKITFDICEGKRYSMNKEDFDQIYQIAQRFGINVEPQQESIQPINNSEVVEPTKVL